MEPFNAPDEIILDNTMSDRWARNLFHPMCPAGDHFIDPNPDRAIFYPDGIVPSITNDLTNTTALYRSPADGHTH